MSRGKAQVPNCFITPVMRVSIAVSEVPEETKGLSQNSLKVLIDLFQKGRRVSGRRPDPDSAESGTPRTSKEFFFLLLFLLDKGEKEGRTLLNHNRAVAFLLLVELMRQPLA